MYNIFKRKKSISYAIKHGMSNAKNENHKIFSLRDAVCLY